MSKKIYDCRTQDSTTGVKPGDIVITGGGVHEVKADARLWYVCEVAEWEAETAKVAGLVAYVLADSTSLPVHVHM